jgi:hypothetical protein
MKKLPHWYEYWGSWMFGWLCLAVTSFIIASIALDVSGRQDWNHSGRLPSDVTQLTASAYLLDRDATTRDIQVCSDRVIGQNDPVSFTQQIDSGQTYIECSREQTWEDTRGWSRNYGETITSLIINPAWLLPVILVALLFSSPFIFVLIRVRHTQRENGKQQLHEQVEGLTENLRLLRKKLEENDLL